jgi:cytoskeleton protein RodZ
VQRSSIGVGPALRKARQARGVSVAEASRDTKIRQEFIEALEDERFDRLLGDVYVRGALRSYSTYLGLPADRVVSRYARTAADPAPAPGAAPLPPTEAVVGAPRVRDDHRLIAMIAGILVIVAAAFGVLSNRDGAPPAAESAVVLGAEALTQPSGPGISLSISTPSDAVDVTVRIDGAAPQTFSLLAGESRAFVADRTVTVRLSRGGTADVVVNGRDYGTPGRTTHPWKQTFSYETASGGSSPAASPSAGA